MKELSIKEKAERYDELLVKLQEAKVDNNVCDERYCCVIDDIVPELKESEDEKIRKYLIILLQHFCKGYRVPGLEFPVSFKDMLSWLEKQGEKSQGKSALEAIKEEKFDNQNCVKPVDEVEHKFKVGYWIIDNNIKTPFQITGISNEKYDVISIYGTDMAFSSREVEHFYHLWSIADAKDGDVLEFGDHGRLAVGIVSYINKSTGKVDVYCLLEANNFKLGNYYALDTINPHPATKEQRDTLMKEMADAGYTFDFEKKELKKIEQKPWSEEDNFMYNKIKNLLTDISLAPESIKSLFDWLKDLKDRVQPQTTWKPSDEQIGALEHFVRSITESGFASPYDSNTKLVYSLFNDLKKLREEQL